MKRVLRIAGITAFYTVLAGIAFGFLGTGLLTIMIMVALLTVICIVVRHLHRISFRFRAEDKGIYRGGDTILGGWN